MVDAPYFYITLRIKSTKRTIHCIIFSVTRFHLRISHRKSLLFFLFATDVAIFADFSKIAFQRFKRADSDLKSG